MSEPFAYCLNTSTIRGQNLTLPEEIDLCAKVGYDGIEPWIRELDAYAEQGGTLSDLRKRIADAGLVVPNLIGFFPWAVDDDATRSEGLEEARRNLDQAAEIGCTGLAAPPMGMTDREDAELKAIAERFARVMELGDQAGVRPILEFWGVSKTLGTLGEALLVAAESGRGDASILADVFHMYKGTGHHAGLKLIGPRTLGLVHVNDYPVDPPRETIKDADRVYPGDGIAPLGEIVADLRAGGYTGMLSVELFNEAYWARPAEEVARTGLDKTRAAVNAA